MSEPTFGEVVQLSDIKYAVAASTHYSADHEVYILRLCDETGTTRNYAFDAAPFEHLRSMIETSILDARPE